MLDQHHAAQKAHDSVIEIMGAQIVAMVANTGFRSFKEWRKPQEFMPSMQGKTAEHPVSLEDRKRHAAATSEMYMRILMQPGVIDSTA
ncbi:hypothetical protein GOB94_14080 [Granulicella sp. 5B5]|uniref:hypothetical protein n=1 Tax=Granulicella sp. 5B5 TaxID=1617967 RepID=UPI0015F6B388|nr:hypothetical protein [Granulicella sp. 5B5]QMV19694.1 hypothetical protein GOB94_14080 [Granulicella sp. 5B5]